MFSVAMQICEGGKILKQNTGLGTEICPCFCLFFFFLTYSVSVSFFLCDTISQNPHNSLKYFTHLNNFYSNWETDELTICASHKRKQNKRN